MVNRAEFLVDGIGQRHPCCTDLDPSIGELVNLEVFTNQPTVGGGIGEQVELALVMQCQRLGDLAQLAPAEDQIQLFISSECAVCVVRVTRFFGEARVVVLDEARHESIGGLDAGDAFQSQLLDQAILQGQMRPLDTPFGGCGVGANTVDIKLKQCPPELCVARTFESLGAVDPKDAGLVAVERQRLAIALQILTRGLEIREC